MGLDISIDTDNRGEMSLPMDQYFAQYALSRTFCNLMCRKDVVGGEPELEQIGRITGIDIEPINEMEYWPGDEGLEWRIDGVSSEAEKKEIQEQAAADKKMLQGNIDKVLNTVNALIGRLSAMPDLPQLLNDHDLDTLGYQTYFTDFATDKGDGYIGNNFGQDLRNFKRFVEYAKSKGSTVVYFSYG